MAKAGVLPRIVARIVGWSASVFMRIERSGPELPPGPVLVAANHPNSLLDPLLIFRTGGRPARPLAKAPLFEQAFTGLFLRALGGLPVYRRQDHPDLMHLNDRTFDAAIAALSAGDAVQIFPEGATHSDPSLQPLRTGAARIALLAEERSDWTLGLVIAPVGLTYSRKELFRGRGLATYGPPFPVARYRELYASDPQAAVRALTDAIASALHAITLNFLRSEDRELVETAERLYAAEKGWTPARAREGLKARFPRLKAFEQGLAWLRVQDPDRHHSLTQRVARYRRKLRALGVEEREVTAQYRALAMVRYLFIDLIPFAVGLPLAFVGSVIWYPLYQGPRILTRLAKPHFEAISSFKVSFGFLIAPLVEAFWIAVGWMVGGWRPALAFGLVAPILGLIAVAWRDRWRDLKADARIFRRAIGREERRRVLTSLRSEFVAEFDRLADEMAWDLDSSGERGGAS